METLLDCHLAIFDRWLQAQFMPINQSHNYAVVTLLDQFDPKECNWEGLKVILPHSFPFFPRTLCSLFGGTKSDLEFSRIVSKFLMDRDRAGSLWVNSQMYVNLATPFSEILRDE